MLGHFYVAGRIKYKYYSFTVCVIKTNRRTGFHLLKKKVFSEGKTFFIGRNRMHAFLNRVILKYSSKVLTVFNRTSANSDLRSAILC